MKSKRVKAKIVGKTKAVDLDIKRFYLDGIVLKAPCPKCDSEAVRDLGEDYLSYPKANAPESVTLTCRKEKADGNTCEGEVEVSIRINLTVEAL